MRRQGGTFCASGAINRGSCGFTLIELMVVLLIVSVFAALTGPDIFRRIEETRAVSEEKKLAFVMEYARNLAFCRQSPFLVRLEDKHLILESSDGRTLQRIGFEFLAFQKRVIRLNAHGFADTREIEYSRGSKNATLALQQ